MIRPFTLLVAFVALAAASLAADSSLRVRSSAVAAPCVEAAARAWSDKTGLTLSVETGGLRDEGRWDVLVGSGVEITRALEGCAVDGPGHDVRVWQAVAGEEVTVFASSSAEGPWVLVEYRNSCRSRCGFDLAEAGIEEARYFRVQDGELFPCPGDSVSEGADIDSVQILNPKP